MNTYDYEAPIIAALLFGHNGAGEIFAALHVDDFNNGFHQNVFAAALKLFNSGDPINTVSVARELCKADADDDPTEIKSVLDEYAEQSTDNTAYYIDALLSANLLTQYNEKGLALMSAANTDDAETIVQEINGLAARNTGHNYFTGTQAALDFAERLEKRMSSPDEYLHWGLAPLDSELYTQLGDFVVLGGRPSAGKTLLAIQLALNMAQRYRVGFVSLETTKEKLIERAISHLAGVPLWKIKQPQALTDEEHARIVDAEIALDKLDIIILDKDNRTAQQIRAFALNTRRQIVFVDYLQKLTGSGKNRFEQVTSISQELQALAQTSGICVIALAQLSRAGVQTDDTPPGLESLRESGQIEQDADVVMLLYLENPANKGGDRILKIAKHKEGRLFQLPLSFDGSTQTLSYIPKNEVDE